MREARAQRERAAREARGDALASTLSKCEAQLNEGEATTSRLLDDDTARQSALDGAESRLVELNEHARKSAAEVDSLKTVLARHEEESKRLASVSTSLEAGKAALESQLAAAQQRCESMIEEHDRSISHERARVDSAQQRVVQLSTALEEQSSQFETQSSARAEAEARVLALDTARASSENERDCALVRVATLEARVGSLSAELRECANAGEALAARCGSASSA